MDYSALSKSLEASLHLTLPPIFISLRDAAPAGVAHVSGHAPAGCSFWERAAKGSFVTTPKDHESCAIGTFTHNLEGTPAHEKDRGDALGIFAQLGYLPASELPGIPVLQKRPSVVVYGPLAESKDQPSLVMLFVKASQSLLLSEAVTGVDGGAPLAMGRPACAVVPQVMNQGRAAMSLGCCGARAYLDALTDDVALFALPGDKLSAYVERLTTLASANQTLSKFHQIRRRDIEAGKTPTILESLTALQQA